MTDRRCRPVTIRGVHYPSHAAAARAFGINPDSVSRAAARGARSLDRVGLGVSDAIPITIDATTYPSRAAAARALGVKYSRLR